MRKTLVAAVALAPICLVLGRQPAHATDNVTNGVNSPIATATATNGAPDDINIESGGSVTVTGNTPAVTQNSANAVTNAGSISLSNVNSPTNGAAASSTAPNAVGVLIQQGTSFTNAGTITNSESYSASDTKNGDGIVEAPFAQGYNRYGILATGGSGLTGAFTNSGTITVQGNDSFGVKLDTPVAGGVVNTGTITLLGDNGTAFATTANGTVSGGIVIEGGITATGQNSTAVNIGGAVNGAVSVYNSITATGFSELTRPTTTSELTNIQTTATDIEQSGAAMIVGGSVSNGIFIGSPPVGTTTTSTGDVDGDGIVDNVEGTGAVTIYGSAPALLIGGANPITIGAYSTTPTTETNVPQPANDYDLIVRGSLNAFGLYDGVTSTALMIGGQGGTVTMNEGVRVVGSINAYSYDANATAIHIGSGATVGSTGNLGIDNEGFIESTIYHSILDTTGTLSSLSTGTTANANPTAYGILIDKGATVPTITNYGYLTAAATGDNASAYGISDQSGTVSKITNEGVISSVVSPFATGDVLSGKTVAIDASANTTGVTLLQQANPNPFPLDVETTTSNSGTTTTTAATTGIVSGSTATSGDSTTTSSTTTSTVTTTAAGVTTVTTATTPTVPSITGDVYLGSGTNTVDLYAGSMVGALDLGTGANSVLDIENTSGVSGAVTEYIGALTYGGTGLALTVNNGVLENTSATTLNLRSLNVGSTGVLYAAVDPVSNRATLYDASSGTVNLASGSQLGVVLNSVLPSSSTYTIIRAGSFTEGNTGGVSLNNVPYIVNAAVTTAADPTTAGVTDVNLTVSTKNAAQLGLNPGQSSALSPIIAALPNDSSIEAELLGQYTRSGFLGVYNQLLPDYAGGVFQMASAASDAITRATSRSNDIENPSGTRGAWAQEFAFGVNRPAAGATGYRGDGFGFVGGLETGGAGLGAFGVTGSFVAGSISDPHAPGDNSQSISEGEFGGYWQGQFGGFRADARLAGGYAYFADHRQLYEADNSGTILLERSAKGSSQGWTGTGHFGAAYQFDFGRWFLRPNAQADYFELNQNGFTEHGGASSTGSDGFDLTVASRQGRQASGLAAMTFGTSIGSGFVWRPEVQVGYRDVFTGTAGNTTANFQGGTPFTLAPVAITGGGPVARVGVKADTDFYELDFQAGAEDRNRFTEADVRLNVRVLF